MKKAILIIISIMLAIMIGCTENTGNKCEKLIYKSKEDKVEPYSYNAATKTFMYRSITVLKFETKDKKTIELKTDTTNQQYENLKTGEEYLVEYDDDCIYNIDNSCAKQDENER